MSDVERITPEMFEAGNDAQHDDDCTDVRSIYLAMRAAAPRDYVIVPRERLEGLNRMLSPGSRTLDELCRDMGYACDTVRALLPASEQEQKP